jgi:HEAT repeat protein
MNTDDDASLDTSRLLTLFTELAQRARMASPLTDILESAVSKIPPKPAQEWQKENLAELTAIATSVKAIAAQLLARRAIPEITNLFFNDDPDIRMAAIMQFVDDVDPEVTRAATHALMARLSTREMLAQPLRARTPPPDRPSLKEMSDDALVARFEDAGLRQSATQFLDPIDEPEDQETQNRVAIEVVDVLEELKVRDLLPRLLPLLASANLTVRWRAAQGCLRLSEREAVASLESVANSLSFDDRMAARDNLGHWRKGKALIDGL